MRDFKILIKKAVFLIIALAFFWALFVLFLFPPELFPAAPYQQATLEYSTLMACVFIICAIIFFVTGQRATSYIEGHRSILVILWILTIISVVVPLLLQASNVGVPQFLFWSYPIIVGLYGLVLSIHLASRSTQFEYRELSVILTLSLLLSFLVAIIFNVISFYAGLIQSESNYFMLIAAGLVVLLSPHARTEDASCQIKIKEDEHTPSLPNAILSEARLKLVLVMTLLCYLLGSGVFVGVYASSTGGLWFSDSIIHYVLGLVLYVLFAIYAYIGWKRTREPYPWVAFAFLCLIVLYCAALFYPSWASFCKGLILPSRPLAMMLLWALILSWARLINVSASWAATALVLPSITTIDLLATAAGFLSFSQTTKDFIVNSVILATAFIVTAGLVVWIILNHRLNAQLHFMDITNKNGRDGICENENEIMNSIVDEYMLSERESEVLALLFEGNTQKKIAQDLMVSINSVQTYAKTLYRKLGIHSRQELIDLVNKRKIDL